VRGLGVAVLIVLGVRTMVRNFDWRDGESLFAADVRTNPQSARLQLFYARDLIRAEQWEPAEERVRRALEIYPEYGDALGNLAHVRAVRGDVAEAKKYYRLALQMAWDNPALQAEYEVFRRVFEEGGASPARDLAAAEESAQAAPGDAKVLRRLADLQSGLGQYRKAISALRQVVALEPGDRRARFALANVLMIDEQYAAAAEQLERLIADDETDWRAHTHLAIARAEDDPEVAVIHAQRAVELAPDEMEPHINLAQALISAKREPEALAVLRALVVRIPQDEPARQVVRRQIELLEHRR
jgi:tetratricopeptide (TPR) repeat protein